MSEPGSQGKRAARDEFQPWAAWTIAFAIGAYWLHGATNHVSLFWPTHEEMLAWGAGFGPTISGGQGWRIFSAAWFHRGVWHAAIDVAALLLVGPRLEKLLGHLSFALLFLASQLGASLATLGLSPGSYFTGATGGVVGVCAAGTVVLALEPLHAEGFPTRVRRALPLGLACALPLAFVPGLGGPGLLGGAVPGALLGLVFDRMARGATGELPLLFGALVVLLCGGALLAFQRASQSPEARAFQLTSDGERALEKKDAAQAFALSGEALALSIGSESRASALGLRMHAAVVLRDPARVEEAATQLLAIDPQAQDALANRCEARGEQNELEGAIADCAAVAQLQAGPSLRAWRLARLAELQLRAGDPAAGLRSAEESIALSPSRAGHILRGQALHALGRAREADQELAEVVRREPNDPTLWLALYSAALKRNDLDEAARDCEQALRLEPDSRNARDARAEVYARRGQFDLAVTQLDQAIAKHPDDAGLLNNRAWDERALGRLEPALKDITRSMELNPNDPPAIGTRCWIEADLGRVEEAKGDCQRSSQKEWPPGVDAGMVRYLAGDFAGADALWSAAIAKDPYLEFQIRDYVAKARAPRAAPAAPGANTANPP